MTRVVAAQEQPPSVGECDRVLQQIAVPLRGLLCAYAPQSDRLMTARPVLELLITANDTSLDQEQVTAALSAFVTLARFSQRFNRNGLASEKSRQRKQHFWLRVFGSSMMHHLWASKEGWQDATLAPLLRKNISPWMLEAPTFPEFAVELKLEDLLESRLSAFAMKSSCSTEGADGNDDASGLQIGVTISSVRLETYDASPEPFIKILRSSFMHSKDRHYVLHDVDTSGMMYQAQLDIANELLRDNNEFYQVHSVMLYKLMAWGHHGQKELKELNILTNRAFGAQATSAGSPQNPLTRVKLDNSLRVQQYAAICSALRYGCVVKELNFDLALYDVSSEEKQQIWRWIAFGVFYPRSQRFASSALFQLQKLGLRHPNLDGVDAEAFVKTLKNPAELASIGKSQASVAPDGLRICVVASGAKIYKSPKATATAAALITTLYEEKELETISTKAGWLCVVIPCVGLGWVEAGHIILVYEDQPYAVLAISVTLDWIEATQTFPQALASFLRNIGHTLESLTLHNAKLTQQYKQVIAAIDSSCPLLIHVCIKESTFVKAVLEELLKSLRGELGKRLISFKLHNNKFRKFPMLEMVAGVLARPNALPLLRELRLDIRPLTLPTLANLEKAFERNKTVEILELQDRLPFEYQLDDVALHQKRQQFTTKYQGELLQLRSALTPREKAAFLSTIVRDSPSDDTAAAKARRALDVEMIGRIFKFAGREVRRQIVWKDAPQGTLRFFG